MLVILSPAKSFSANRPQAELPVSRPVLLSESEVVMNKLRTYSAADLAALMKLSDDLARLNTERHQHWQPPFTPENAMPAILAFTGEVYRGLNAASLNPDDLAFAQKHVRILSGLYGVLRPLDLIQPYRLEMGTKLSVNGSKNLYDFWRSKITAHLNEVLDREKVLINLASNEYFKAIDLKKLNGEVITPVFKDFRNGRYKVLMTYAKNARGAMTRYIIVNKIADPQLLKGFDSNGYAYTPDLSDRHNWVFTRG